MAEPDGLEDGLIHQASDLWRGTQVEVLEVVAGELQRERQRFEQPVVVDGQAAHDGLGVGPLLFDALLLLGEQLLGDVVGVVLAQQLALLLLEVGEDAVAALDLITTGTREVGKVRLHGTLDVFAIVLGEADRGVVALDGGFDVIDALDALRAGAALVGRADEVLVEAAASSAA